jgi:hypothetical protein
MTFRSITPGLLIGALALCSSGGAVAQSAPTTGEKVTVAGCVQRAQRNGSVGGTIVGTSAAPNTADDEANSSALVDAFLLTEATPVSAGVADPSSATRADSAQAGATGTSGRVDPTTFGLVGREAEIERHQGARLQVTGTIMPAASSGRGTGGAATAAGAKRLQVESFKILAEKCGSN